MGPIETDDSVQNFLNAVKHPKRQKDALAIYQIMKSVSQQSAKMWGKSIIGFGRYKYEYKSGRKGEFFKIGFSPRKQAISIYFMNGFYENTELLNKLGKFKTSKACLYINKVEDINLDILRLLIQDSYDYMTSKYG